MLLADMTKPLGLAVLTVIFCLWAVPVSVRVPVILVIDLSLFIHTVCMIWQISATVRCYDSFYGNW